MSISWSTLKTFLFSFKGRISRKQYNLYFLLPYVLVSIPLSILDMVTGLYDERTQTGLFSGIFTLVMLWPMLAVATKRLQDRGVSGWRQLTYFIILIVGSALAAAGMLKLNMVMMSIGFFVLVTSLIAFIVELCFLKGTDGPNKYGPDPLAV